MFENEKYRRKGLERWPTLQWNLPAPLQQPYAADPDTLEEWLVSKTTELGRVAVLEVLSAMSAKYVNVTGDLLLHHEQVDAIPRELAEDVLASEGLGSFLAVTTPEGGTPTVITMSRLSRFRSGTGADIAV